MLVDTVLVCQSCIAFEFLAPRFVFSQGEGEPKTVYWSHVGNDFRNWFRTLPEAHGAFAEFGNPWPAGSMRKFFEDMLEE